MARISPTKSNLLQLKRELDFAREGYDLLEEKRQVLVLEIMRHAEQAKQLEAEVEERLERAHRLLSEAAVRSGEKALASHALGVTAEHSVKVTHRRLMGISLPVISATQGTFSPAFGTGMALFARGETSFAFRDALRSIGELAEVQATVLRLARELRKTQRRVNALDKVFIPGHERSVKRIESALEEREREEHVVLRRIRERGEATWEVRGSHE